VSEPIDLAAIAAQALAAPDVEGLTVDASLDPAWTDGDARLVERLAANLVDNAVAHNRCGGSIAVATRTAGGRAILAVANSGPEIAPGELGRLFEPFQRLDGSRTSAAEGLGLGLSIVRAIADAHGAAIATRLPAGGGLAIEIVFAAGAAAVAPARAPAVAAAAPAAAADRSSAS
jgi:signal transduction histidine kinase